MKQTQNNTMKNRISKSEQNQILISKMVLKVRLYTVEQFKSDAKQWIDSIKRGSMCCTVEAVSSSGMSRVFCYRSFNPSKGGRGYYRNYFAFMQALGFSPAGKNYNGFRVHGCGMDMNFDTCYRIAHKLHNLGLLSKKDLDKVSQSTPTIF